MGQAWASDGSPSCGAETGSCSPRWGWSHQPSSSMQFLSCTSSTRQMCSSLSQQPGWCSIPCCQMVAPHSLRENRGLLFVCKGKEPAQDIHARALLCKQPLQALVLCAPQESSVPEASAARDGCDLQVAATRGPLLRDKQSVLPPPRCTLLCQWLWRAQPGRELGGKLNWPDENLLWRQPCWSGRRRNACCSQLYQPGL